MKKSAIFAPTFLILALAGACGGGEGDVSGDGDGDGDAGDGDAGDGDTSGDGDGDGQATGGALGDGDGDTGGMGAASTGGAAATGGLGNGSGGLPNSCGCDAPYSPACGVDGTTYDAGCGDECVPVEIDCRGACPCAGCECEVVDGEACDTHERQWLCGGNGHDPAAFEAEGCEVLPTGAVRYCCPLEVVPEDFCL